MNIVNSSGWSIETPQLDWAPGHWDAFLVAWPGGRNRNFVGTFGSKKEALSAAKAELERRDSLTRRIQRRALPHGYCCCAYRSTHTAAAEPAQAFVDHVAQRHFASGQ